jgi:hypothetical protein
MKIFDIQKPSTSKASSRGTLFDRFDLFATPIPSFTINNRTHQGSSIGLICSVLCALVVAIFSIERFIYLTKR